MANVNMVILAGNLTRDPEMRYTPSGMAIAQLGLAINRKFKDPKSNEMREEVTFVDVDLFGRQAETASQYLAKGRGVFIEGRLKFDQWEDKQTGQKRSKLKVVAIRWQFIGAAGGAGAAGGSGGPARQAAPVRRGAAAPDPGAAAPAQVPEGEPDLDIPEDDIPF